ncbi:NAD(P)/FAD-dependent oxidoreductase [Rapidithrix thailandica]|uniref:NAD(P)/FAD-dependent oxidoreductase n=1 Tax=Rapidithrix thailandica TaxID=413964 RepID=A0AAW9SK02_9BACT
MDNYDICVVGAGPSGSVIAKKLARFGYSVVLIEKEKFPRKHIGLSLTPGIHHWLGLLGLKEEVNKAGFTRALESFILWESNEVVKKEFKPDLAGYHVDRGKFDQILLHSALADGVRLLQPCTVNRLDQCDDGDWKISVTQFSTQKHLFAKFIVEATGRKSVLTGSKKAYLPKTLATYTYWKSIPTNPVSFVEAGKNEWYWGAPVGKGYMACIFSDPETIRKFASVQDFYFRTMNHSSLFASLGNIGGAGDIIVCDATAYKEERPVSNRYIKVGDAAFTMDPLSSQGVQKAIKSAYQGAIVVNSLLKDGHSHAALEYYHTLIRNEVLKNTQWTKQFYNRQKRFDGGAFWDVRKDAFIPGAKEPPETNVSLKKEDRLFMNPNAVIIDVPVVGEYRIEYCKGVRLEENDEPFVFLQNTSIASLIKNMHGKPLIECLQIIEHTMPHSPPLEVLRWLLYHRVISN